MTDRCVAIVQARMGSRRLPGKVLADILGRPMLERVLVRLGRARTPDEVIVATSAVLEDDPIADLCERLAVPYSRGSAEDVLDRFHQAADERRADTIVRITADCPLIDPELVDETVRLSAGLTAGGLRLQSASLGPDLPDRHGHRSLFAVGPGRRLARGGSTESA
jgi:spore coat polysaccharide biosynthesis protein SpsF (cytidylyltransferase family)